MIYLCLACTQYGIAVQIIGICQISDTFYLRIRQILVNCCNVKSKSSENLFFCHVFL